MKIVSYNCSGLYGNRMDYVKEFLNDEKPEIMLIQETWLVKKNMDVLHNVHDAYLCTGKSGVPDDHMLMGRPFGGVAILWHKSLAGCIEVIPVKSLRINAVLLTLAHGSKLLIINTYFPCDIRRISEVSDEYEETISAIEELLISCSYNEVIIGGDFNTDYERNNSHSKRLQSFVRSNDLKDLWQANLCKENVTYVTSDMTAKSCIDHFIVS